MTAGLGEVRDRLGGQRPASAAGTPSLRTPRSNSAPRGGDRPNSRSGFRGHDSDGLANTASAGATRSGVQAAGPDSPSGGGNAIEEEGQARRMKVGTRAQLFRGQMRVNKFTELVERTVDSLRAGGFDGAYEDAKRILANIRKQYDEVHAEAEKRESELMDIRKEVRLNEADSMTDPRHPQALSYSDVSKDEVVQKIEEVTAQIDESATTKRVYSHMVTRLKCEQKIVEQKIKIMEEHLLRKTREVEKRQELSRRTHNEKVQTINELEAMEWDVEQERIVCSTALDDLETTLQQRRNEVRRREDFERWRYEVAMEAANEAFLAMAGRFRKIYAIEKLTGNCLQKIIFEQAEKGQTTEEGFQKIREVTGLIDVMDIVHKFLNREVEHEQLRASVREAELRLHSLTESESTRRTEGLGYNAEGSHRPRGLNTEVVQQEQQLHKAQRDHEIYQLKLRQTTLLVDNIMQWAHRMAKSLASFEELEDVECPNDIVPFFASLLQTVERFFRSIEMPPTKLSKLTSQACTRDHAEQQRLLSDKDFLRANCRVPATPDSRTPDMRPARGGAEEERHDMEVASERERLKHEAQSRVAENTQIIRVHEKSRRNDRDRSADVEKKQKRAARNENSGADEEMPPSQDGSPARSNASTKKRNVESPAPSARKVCAACGAPCPQDAKGCPKCGKALPLSLPSAAPSRGADRPALPQAPSRPSSRGSRPGSRLADGRPASSAARH